MQQLTIEKLIREVNFSSSLDLNLNNQNIQVYLVDMGTEYLCYYVFLDSKLLFHGMDFTTPFPIQNVKTVVQLLERCTTSQEPNEMNQKQIEWAGSQTCEMLTALIRDFKDKRAMFHQEAQEFFDLAHECY